MCWLIVLYWEDWYKIENRFAILLDFLYVRVDELIIYFCMCVHCRKQINLDFELGVFKMTNCYSTITFFNFNLELELLQFKHDGKRKLAINFWSKIVWKHLCLYVRYCNGCCSRTAWKTRREILTSNQSKLPQHRCVNWRPAPDPATTLSEDSKLPLLSPTNSCTEPRPNDLEACATQLPPRIAVCGTKQSCALQTAASNFLREVLPTLSQARR